MKLNEMFVGLAGAVALSLAAVAAEAQTSYGKIGSTLYGSDGYNGRQIGGTMYHNNIGGTGLNGTSRNIGSTTYHNLGGVSGTSNTIGGTTYHNIGGQMTTSRTIGGTTYHNHSDGTTTSCRMIGNRMYCN